MPRLVDVAAVLCCALVAACSPVPAGLGTVGATASGPVGSVPASPATATGGAPGPSYAVPDPGPLDGRLYTADVLIRSTGPITAALRRRVAAVRGVEALLPMSVAALAVDGRTLTVAAADPAGFRRFTPVQSAQTQEVWSRVAHGEVAVAPTVSHRLERPRGYLTLGNQEGAPRLHIGAYAPLVRDVAAFVNPARAEQLGIPAGNALLVSTGRLTPSAVTGGLRRVLGDRATLQVLALEFDVDAPRTAVLAGGSVAAAVGTFDYVPHADGRVTPDPRWVASYIRTESVPILGPVTCNKAMFPQLRAALQEVVDRGLADRIHPREYGGCYHPRYIGHDPAKGLSLHTWGIAVDLNVPGNQRGTVGQMDRQVVAIFEKWGFVWGGGWRYTDPMHFELAALVTPR
jgi:hypothetical protein